MTDWDVERWLRDDGEPGAAHAWRGWCAQLAGPARLLVLARDAALAARVAAPLAATGLGVDLDPGPGIQESLFTAHAVLWATSATAALGAEERATLARLEALGAPKRRAIYVADLALLARLADDPEAEAADVTARVGRLAPWPLVTEILPWLSSTEAANRVAELAATVVAAQHERAASEAAAAAEGLAEIDGLIAREDAQLADGIAAAARLSRHLRAGARRQLAAVNADLRDFLVSVEQALPAELAAVADPVTVERALPHWLQHVVTEWLVRRLADAGEALRADLDGILPAEDVARLQLVLPAVVPGAVRGEAEWSARIGATLAIGGGAAMLLFGLWAPGLAAVAGGVAWSALGRGFREGAGRARLLDTAIAAVRGLATELPAALEAQVVVAEAERDTPATSSEVRLRLLARRAALTEVYDAAAARAQRWQERTS